MDVKLVADFAIIADCIVSVVRCKFTCAVGSGEVQAKGHQPGDGTAPLGVYAVILAFGIGIADGERQLAV